MAMLEWRCWSRTSQLLPGSDLGGLRMEQVRSAGALGAVTGMVAGLGTITPASGFVGPGGALVIGISAGFVCYNATVFLKQKLKLMIHSMYFPSTVLEG